MSTNFYDYYLNAESENALWEALISAGLVKEYSDSETGTFKAPVNATISLDVIGLIHKGTGNMIEVNDPEMGTYTYEETSPIEGFHANLRMFEELTEEQKAILPLIESPNTPVRKWFGDE
jgi:hypothetical protein